MVPREMPMSWVNIGLLVLLLLLILVLINYVRRLDPGGLIRRLRSTARRPGPPTVAVAGWFRASDTIRHGSGQETPSG